MERRRKRKQRRRRRDRHFTPAEANFFAEGEQLAEQGSAQADSFEDLESGAEPASFWSRLARRQAEA